jgi:hypothetical protein
MSINTVKKSLRLATQSGNMVRVMVETYRLKKLEEHQQNITLETARDEVLGAVLLKKEVVDLWNELYGPKKIFGNCCLCECPNSVNPVRPNILELRKTQTRIFVCSTCSRNNILLGWIHKRTNLTVVDTLRLKTWLNLNLLRRQALCYCCRQVTMDMLSSDWHTGHIVSDKNGGTKTVKNLRPVCSGCNIAMGHQEMHDYMQKKYKHVCQDNPFDNEVLVQTERLFN